MITTDQRVPSIDLEILVFLTRHEVHWVRKAGSEKEKDFQPKPDAGKNTTEIAELR